MSQPSIGEGSDAAKRTEGVVRTARHRRLARPRPNDDASGRQHKRRQAEEAPPESAEGEESAESVENQPAKDSGEDGIFVVAPRHPADGARTGNADPSGNANENTKALEQDHGFAEHRGHPLDAWLGFGPLAPYLAEEDVTDLFLNGATGLWTDDGTGLKRRDSWSADERALRDLAVQLIALGGRHIDEATPCVDVRLRDGVRVHAVLPPVSIGGTLLSIRVPRRVRFRLSELAAAGTLSDAQLTRVRRAVDERTNLLITGAGGSGKTTLLSAILAEAAASERIVTIEDVAELQVQHPHVVSLEARQPNLEGAGEIGLSRLLREALRMRPDRLVLGECRGAEVRELLSALNTGHDGGAGTLHANSLADVPARLEALAALAGMDALAVARQAVSAIGLVLHLERVRNVRRLAQVGRFELGDRGRLMMVEERT